MTAPTVQEMRAAAVEKAPGTAPAGAARLLPFGAQLRVAELVEWQGEQRHQLDGIASTTEQPYEMWDFFGTYTEVIDGHAFDETLAADPDVAFLMNHKGVTMARTRGKRSLELSVDSLGLRTRAYVNPERADVRDMVIAIKDRDITEMSFAFMIEDGSWNDDYTQFRITKVNLDRGDVSAVNYGANPYTSIAARSREIIDALGRMPAGAARAALSRLQARSDLAPPAPPAAEVSPDPAAALPLVDMAALRAEVQRRGGLEPSLLSPSKLVPPVPGLAPADRSDVGRSVALLRTQLLVDDDF
jgi:hypothetical protein